MLVANDSFELKGNAYELSAHENEFPNALKMLPDPPKKLYLIGNIDALKEGVAFVGARKATPYGISCTKHFASIAAQNDLVVISGGAFGCDSAAHRAALALSKKTIVFLGGGCNKVYPRKNLKMFQEVIDKGGAIVSEQEWTFDPLPFTFLQRNRLIAGLSKATLIVEAGLPSGTFSTADFAIKYGKEVLSIPGAITNENSAGCNKLIAEGAIPIINDKSFYEVLFSLFSIKIPQKYKDIAKNFNKQKHKSSLYKNEIIEAILAEPMSVESLFEIAQKCCKAKNPSVWLSEQLINAEQEGLIAKYPNGMYGPIIKD